MSIQNNVNAMLGTVAAATAMGKHVSEQKKTNGSAATELEVSKIEAEKEEYDATNKLKDFDSKLVDEEIAKNGYDTEVDPDKILENRYNKSEADFKQAQDDKAFTDFFGGSKKQVNQVNKNLEMAAKAFEEVNSLIEARNNLKFDKDIARKKIDVINKKVEKLGGKK